MAHDPFTSYRGLASLTIEQLVGISREIISTLVPAQRRYKVTTFPTARTIRYYMSIGAVDKPHVDGNGASRFAYRHLLQTVAVKALQSQDTPLRKIAGTITRLTETQLETVALGVIAAAGPSPRVHDPGETPPPPGGCFPDLWHRVEVAPGVELLVLDAAMGEGQRERLRGALLREIAAMRGWTGDGQPRA